MKQYLRRIALSVAMGAVILGLLGGNHALAVTFNTVDLHPSGFGWSEAVNAGGMQQVGGGSSLAAGGTCHALLWSGTAANAIDLNPSGFAESSALATNGTQQVGTGFGLNTGGRRALLWSGTAESVVDLNPSGFYNSIAQGICGSQQVGYAMAADNNDHAFLWSGTAASAVDLHPSGFTSSFAGATSGTQQVGDGLGTATGGAYHALLWSGTAASAVDLHPAGFDRSFAYGVGGTQQVGVARTAASGGYDHALLWNGSADTAIDLNPSGFVFSQAYGTSGFQQVGYGYGSPTGGYTHALLWSGTANSFVDLHQFLPNGFTASYAKAIDAHGNIVGYARDASGNNHAILWQAVPEPSALALFGMSAFGLLVFVWRRRRTIHLAAMVIVTAVVLTAGMAKATNVFNMPSGQQSLEFVTVGDQGNAADTTGYGSVDQTYQIGKYDVTLAQYCQFLNAVAKTDTYGLYNPYLATTFPDSWGVNLGIIRSGSAGSFSYSLMGNGNVPVFEVSWGDAARFCNWLQNGQPTGSQGQGVTETGAYTLNGAISSSALMAVKRNAGATYFIPSENEWYKAAYYKGGGSSAGYWLYPTRSNTAPSNVLSSTGTNNANFNVGTSPSDRDHFSDPTNILTSVGAFAASPGPYGTYDQAGILWQWNETEIGGSSRGVHGGNFGNAASLFAASMRNSFDTLTEGNAIGFRVASVPEPCSLLMTALIALGGLTYWYRSRKAV